MEACNVVVHKKRGCVAHYVLYISFYEVNYTFMCVKNVRLVFLWDVDMNVYFIASKINYKYEDMFKYFFS